MASRRRGEIERKVGSVCIHPKERGITHFRLTRHECSLLFRNAPNHSFLNFRNFAGPGWRCGRPAPPAWALFRGEYFPRGRRRPALPARGSYSLRNWAIGRPVRQTRGGGAFLVAAP